MEEAPLKILLPMDLNWLCDRSLRVKWEMEKKEDNQLTALEETLQRPLNQRGTRVSWGINKNLQFMQIGSARKKVVGKNLQFIVI